MKSTARISIVAVCLCASTVLAQDESQFRARGVRTQRAPSSSFIAGSINSSGGPMSRPQLEPPRSQFRPPPQTMQGGPLPQGPSPLPTPTPEFRRKLQRQRQTAKHREDEIAPSHAGSSADARNPKSSSTTTTGNPPVRHKSKKQQQEKSRSVNKSRPAESPAAVEHHKAERAVVAPAQTPVISPMTPARAAETEPIVSPSPPPAVAITPSERPPQMQAQPQPTQSHLQRAILNDLSEDERARLHSAHQNALQQDPNLAASRARYLNARKEFREKLRDALLKTDPSVRPILDKIHREQNDDR
jgi:hypothetical protein